MPDRAVLPGERFAFVPPDEEDRHKADPSYRPLTLYGKTPDARDQIAIEEALRGFDQEGRLQIRTALAYVVACERCLDGWENLEDSEGRAVEFNREDSSKNPGRLRPERRRQFYGAVMKRMSLDQEDFGEPDSPPGSQSSREHSTAGSAPDGSAALTNEEGGSGPQASTGSQ